MLLVDSYGICALASTAGPRPPCSSSAPAAPSCWSRKAPGPSHDVGPMRWGTSLVLVLLLVLILIAAIIQFVFRLGPS